MNQYNNFENFDHKHNKDSSRSKKKHKGHKHRKHYDFNDDFQKNKQFKLKKQRFDDQYFDPDAADDQ